MDSIAVVASLIVLIVIFVGSIAICARSAERRADERNRALLSRLDVLGFALQPPAATAPAHRGLQRLPVVVLPSVARRVVDVTRDPETPAPPPSAERGAIVDVDLSVGIADDTTRGRWLRHVLGTSASPLPGSQEHRGIQRLHLVSPLPPDSLAREDDTPAPEAQRAPVLPPPSSSPLRPSRR
jgi:hypothetical protein